MITSFKVYFCHQSRALKKTQMANNRATHQQIQQFFRQPSPKVTWSSLSSGTPGTGSLAQHLTQSHQAITLCQPGSHCRLKSTHKWGMWKEEERFLSLHWDKELLFSQWKEHLYLQGTLTIRFSLHRKETVSWQKNSEMPGKPAKHWGSQVHSGTLV